MANDISLNERIGSVTDIGAGKMITESRYSYAFVSQASIQIYASGASGFIHSLFVGAISQPSLQVKDIGSGALIATMSPNPPIGTYLLDVQYLSGLTLQFGAGAVPQVTVASR